MGIFDNLGARFTAWRAERKEKEREKASEKERKRSIADQHQPRGGSVSVSVNASRSRQQGQQVSPHAALDEDLFAADEEYMQRASSLPDRSPQRSPLSASTSSGSSSTVPPRSASAMQAHQAAGGFRSSSPTSMPTQHNSQLSTHDRAVHGPGSHVGGLGSSPSSDNFGSRLHPPMFPSHSSHTTPQRGARLGASSHESKEDDDSFDRDLDAASSGLEAVHFGGASAATSSSAASPLRPTEQTEDERFAELLQQQEYLAFLEENGDLSHADAAMLSAQAEEKNERDLRRARRRERRALEAARGAVAGEVEPHTPSPAPDEASAAAAASFASFQARTHAAVQVDYRAHAASSADAHRPHVGDSYRPHAQSAASSLSGSPLPPAHPHHHLPSRMSALSSPSRSHSYSQSQSGAPTPVRASSLSRSELHALPVFAYVPSPNSSVAKAAAKAKLDESTDDLDLTDIALPATPVDEDEETPSCSICLGDYELNDKLRCLPCLHKFHSTCVSEWFLRSSLCPMCNTDVREAF